MDENKGFKMKGSSLYGKLKLNRNMDNSSLSDGRAKSSALQKNEDEGDKKHIGGNLKKKITNSKLAKDLKKASAQVGGDLLKLQGYKSLSKDKHPKGDVHPQQVKGYEPKLIPSTSPQHKYLYKKK